MGIRWLGLLILNPKRAYKGRPGVGEQVTFRTHKLFILHAVRAFGKDTLNPKVPPANPIGSRRWRVSAERAARRPRPAIAALELIASSAGAHRVQASPEPDRLLVRPAPKENPKPEGPSSKTFLETAPGAQKFAPLGPRASRKS